MTFKPYAKQSIQEEDIQAVATALNEEFITRGPLVRRFEEAIAEFCHVPYVVAFSSGTAALAAAYFAARLTPSDRVISSPNTFIASINTPIQMGIKPTFVDIDRKTGNLDLEKLALLLRNFHSTRGRPFLIPVHFAGRPIAMDELDHSIIHSETVIIEDAAHAFGSSYPTGQKVGSCAYSDMTIFSFHPAKTITTGEGGVVTTRDTDLFHRLQLFRDNGIERSPPYLEKEETPGYYEVKAVTGNFHLTSFQAALGLSQLQRLEAFISKRRLLVERYRKNLSDSPKITLFSEKQTATTAFHLFVAQIDFPACRISRRELMSRLKEKEIGSQIHYIPLYDHPVLRSAEREKENCPQMEAYYQQALTLPLYYDLHEEEVDDICTHLLALIS